MEREDLVLYWIESTKKFTKEWIKKPTGGLIYPISINEIT